MKIKFEGGEWVELPHGSKESPFYIDGILKSNLDTIKKIIRNNWDYVFIVDGQVGAGKSIFTQQLAYYCDDARLSVKEIVFTSREFEKVSTDTNLAKYRSVIFDEAFRGLSSRASLSYENKKILEILNEIRQRNLFLFIVLPSIWDLDNYVKLHRARGLFHVITDSERNRGYFKFFRNDPETHEFKSFFSNVANRYKYPSFCQFKGRFTDYTPMDREEYDKKKSEAFHNTTEIATKANIKASIDKSEYLMPIYHNLKALFPSISQEKTAKILNINRKTLKNWLFDRQIRAQGILNLGIEAEDEKE